MSDILTLITKVRNLANCIVYPAAGFPGAFVDSKLYVPNDLREFYSLCGGVELFVASEYPLRIVSPAGFRMGNPEIVGEIIDDDITSTWYVLAEGRSGEYITIDLSPTRAGRCYDSYVDRHGIVGSCPILALSFLEFFKKILTQPGARFYWLSETFTSCGDAYDSVT